MEYGLSERTLRQHRKEKEKIDEQMVKFGNLPEDYEEFVGKTVFDNDNYIFYSSKKGKAYCTRCGKEFELTKEKHLRHKTIAVWNDRDEVRHNHEVACPFCNKWIKCKSDGMSRQSLLSIQWSVLVQKFEEEVLVRYFCHTKDFRTDYRKPKIETYERYRTVHTDEKGMDFEWSTFKSTGEYRWCNYKDRSYGWTIPSEFNVPRSAYLYNTDLAEVTAGTCMKYSAADIFVDKVNKGRYFKKPWMIDWYFNEYRKKPYLEQLLKVGFYKLTEQVFTETSFTKIPELNHGRSILDTLEISKTNFKMLREVGDPSWREVCILKYGQNLSMKEFNILRFIVNDHNDLYKKYIDMKQYTTIYKLDKYIKQNNIVKHDYFDYVRWLNELGYDMRNEFNLYPKNFEKAHDEKSNEYIKHKNKEAREELKKFNKLLKKMQKEAEESDAMNLKIAGLFIRLPYSTKEIKQEGEILHHCVGTYVDRVARGETSIFFIRKVEEPDKPYFTLEYKNERVVQCRGFKNCSMNDEVKAFTQLFEEKMKESTKDIDKKLLKHAS